MHDSLSNTSGLACNHGSEAWIYGSRMVTRNATGSNRAIRGNVGCTDKAGWKAIAIGSGLSGKDAQWVSA